MKRSEMRGFRAGRSATCDGDKLHKLIINDIIDAGADGG
jgi:hypothetical protein